MYPFAVLLAAAPSPSAQTAEPAAALLLARAGQNHFAGDFSAAVTCIRESFLGGRDTLTGVLEVRASAGERSLVLSGSGETFEWWSRLDGREQWRRAGAHGRLRRLPPHSLRKPAFAPDISYEDLGRLPFGHLEGYGAARRGPDTDGSLGVTLLPDARRDGSYASLTASFADDPVRLARIAFEGHGPRPSKIMTLGGYVPFAGGSLPTEITFRGEEGLSSVTLRLAPRTPESARDKAAVGSGVPRGQGFADPRWRPSDDPD